MFNIPFALLTGILFPEFSDSPARSTPTPPASKRTTVKPSPTETVVKTTPEITPDTCWNCKRVNTSFAHRMNCNI